MRVRVGSLSLRIHSLPYQAAAAAAMAVMAAIFQSMSLLPVALLRVAAAEVTTMTAMEVATACF
jgi:hypothetical protein